MNRPSQRSFQLPTSRLSRRVVFWVFVSVIVIEAIILIPSYRNRERELLAQLKSLSSAKVSLILQVADPEASDSELLAKIKMLQAHHMIIGGAFYRDDGELIGFFGERPDLAPATAPFLLNGDKTRYDIRCIVSRQGRQYEMVVRHDASGVKRELKAFIMRIAGLVVIISLFVTVGAWLALLPIVLTPILKLRQDLTAAGDTIIRDQQAPAFQSSSVDRNDELGEVVDAFRKMYHQIVEAIDNRKSAEAALQESYQQLSAYSQMLNDELEKGRRMQVNFLPAALLQTPQLESAAFFKPARQVAGDFYDIFRLPCDRVGLVIADVCDKGVGAALFMALFRSLIRIFSGQVALEGITAASCNPDLQSVGAAEAADAILPDQAETLKAVQLTNDYIAANHGDLGMFATLFFGVLQPSTGALTYINAGHDAQLIIGAGGGIRSQLGTTGPAVGVQEHARFDVAHAQLAPGEVLLGFTDGVTEASNPGGNFYTLQRLYARLERPPHSASKMIEWVVADVLAHTGAAELHDDITLLSVRRK